MVTNVAVEMLKIVAESVAEKVMEKVVGLRDYCVILHSWLSSQGACPLVQSISDL